MKKKIISTKIHKVKQEVYTKADILKMARDYGGTGEGDIEYNALFNFISHLEQTLK